MIPPPLLLRPASRALLPAVLLLVAGPAPAAEPAAGVDDGFPFLTACVTAPAPAGNTALKGVVIRLPYDAAMCWDTDLLRWSAGWIAPADWKERQARGNREMAQNFPGWSERILHLEGVSFSGEHGGHPSIVGTQIFGTAKLSGWAAGAAAFKDPRPEPFGPVPEPLGRHDAVYTVGPNVVVAYTVGGAKVWEQPGAVSVAGRTAVTRTLRLAGAFGERHLLAATVPGATSGKVESRNGTSTATVRGADGTVTLVGAVKLPAGAGLAVLNDTIAVKLPAGATGEFTLAVWRGAEADAGKFPALLQAAGALKMADFQQGGPAYWPQAVETKGQLATSKTPDGAYMTDRLTAPENNPWKRRVRFGGLDFFKDGTRAALSTWDGDVWIVSGIDEKLEKLTWKRFAAGGYETLGLVIKDDVIHTSGRDQITRYRDLNGDGQADAYENFNNQVTSSTGFHEFQFDLHVDAAGNFYTAKAGPVRGGGRGFGGGGGNGDVTRDAGTVQRISADGKTREVIARGFRAPNGIGVRADGQVTTGDNEGTWVPACPINWIKPGGFYGVEEMAAGKTFADRDVPLAWLHHGTYDNSGGSQVWVTSDRWGPFKESLLHLSYGQCAVYVVLPEKLADGRMQGGVVRLPLRFTSSAMRGRFNPADGQLYVAGLQGWQTKATRLTGLDRVRYTGGPVRMASGLKVVPGGVQVTFTQPLDPATATDAASYSAEAWNYEVNFEGDKRQAGQLVRADDHGRMNYGGHEVQPGGDGRKLGRAKWAVKSATLSPDGKTLTLNLPDLKPVQQLLLKLNVDGADGEPMRTELLQTIHAVPAGG